MLRGADVTVYVCVKFFYELVQIVMTPHTLCSVGMTRLKHLLREVQVSRSRIESQEGVAEAVPLRVAASAKVLCKHT